MRIIPFERKEELEAELLRIAVLPSMGHSGKVIICAVDEFGHPLPNGELLRISQEGVERCEGVSDDLGIRLTNYNNGKLYLV